MRPYALVSIALLALAACSGNTNAKNAASPSPGGTPLGLHSCEQRELSLDGAQLFVQANADGTPAQIVVLQAPNDDVRTKAYQDAVKDFGEPHPDLRTQTKQYKWGMVQLTDMCGRPVVPQGSSSPTPTPTPQ